MFYLHYLSKTCPPGHCHNSFMATGALGHIHIWLHVLGIQDPNKAQVNTRATRLIIHTKIYQHTQPHTHTHTHIYIYIYTYTYVARDKKLYIAAVVWESGGSGPKLQNGKTKI